MKTVYLVLCFIVGSIAEESTSISPTFTTTPSPSPTRSLVMQRTSDLAYNEGDSFRLRFSFFNINVVEVRLTRATANAIYEYFLLGGHHFEDYLYNTFKKMRKLGRRGARGEVAEEAYENAIYGITGNINGFLTRVERMNYRNDRFIYIRA